MCGGHQSIGVYSAYNLPLTGVDGLLGLSPSPSESGADCSLMSYIAREGYPTDVLLLYGLR